MPCKQSSRPGNHAEAPVDAGASDEEGASGGEKRPAFRASASADVDHGVNVWSKTVTPPWTTVILTLVNAMSVMVAVQLPFGQPAS
jgi:hypothetical protein